jgi:hypothetical protein
MNDPHSLLFKSYSVHPPQSPEVSLNSMLFTHLFFSIDFQALLVLITVDKAHIIICGGLWHQKKPNLSTHLIAIRIVQFSARPTEVWQST